jgi:hypothetical protein
MSKIGDTISDAIEAAVAASIKTAVDELDEKIDKFSDKLDALDTRVDEVDDEMPDKADVKNLIRLLSRHDYSAMCDQVDSMSSRIDDLERAGTFNDGHKKIIVDLIHEEFTRLSNKAVRDIIRTELKPSVIDIDQLADVVKILRDIRELLKNKE